MKVENKVIVVTGGGSGIGRALVHKLLNKGAKVAAVDINETTLQETVELAGVNKANVSTHIVNIADRAAVEALAAAVIAAHGVVDGLINNAGIIQPFVRINDLDYDAIDRVINVNLYGLIHMVKSFLPLLLERPAAHIVNVSSMGGFFPVPGQAMYGATKAAVKLMTEGLYAELLETNVGVTVIFPGAIETNITENSGIDISAMDTEGASMQATSAEDAAEVIVDAMEKAKFNAFIGGDAKMMDKLYRVAPKRATQFMQRQMKALLPEQ